MGTFRISHDIQCGVDLFWKVFFDKTFNEQMFKTELGFPEYSVLELRETDKEIIRRVSAMPKMNLPGPLSKLFGNGFRYVEEGHFDRQTKIWKWKMTPSTLADKLRQEGTLRVEPVGEHSVRRVAELIIEAKVFGVGGLIESTGEKQLRQGWDESARFLNKWLADGKAK